jgi:nitrile hydratase
MDGVHDMGGMHGFGAVLPEADEPVFHADWESRVFAMTMLSPFVVPSNGDQFRKTMERMPPAAYLHASYYEKWLAALVGLLTGAGAASADEIGSGLMLAPLPQPFASRPAGTAALVPVVVAHGSSQAAGAAPAPRFGVGDRVRTRGHMGFGHNRLPRYARDKLGTVEQVLGSFLLPDAHSEGQAVPEAVYTVVFAAQDLWGAEANARDSLSLDLWDSYLDPA